MSMIGNVGYVASATAIGVSGGYLLGTYKPTPLEWAGGAAVFAGGVGGALKSVSHAGMAARVLGLPAALGGLWAGAQAAYWLHD